MTPTERAAANVGLAHAAARDSARAPLDERSPGVVKPCTVCGNVFTTTPTAARITCSHECAVEHRRRSKRTPEHRAYVREYLRWYRSRPEFLARRRELRRLALQRMRGEDAS